MLALDSGTAWQASLLGLAYSLGLGIPCLVLALGLGWASRGVTWMRRHSRTINLVGGGMLIVLGVLMLAGICTRFADAMQGWVGDVTTIL